MKKIPSFLLLFTAIFFTACISEFQQGVVKEGDCIPESLSYKNHVSPILSASCVSCHSGNSPSGGVLLSTYEEVKAMGESGKLLGSIKHEAGFSNMPKGSDKLSDCTIKIIETWINTNYPK